jgi:pimeloyl-ACP methyl ester carboxylesterase
LAQETPQPLPIYEFGGHGPAIHLAVANGFPPQTYKPLLDPLAGSYRAVTILPRALWPSPPPPETLTSWRQMADDILQGLRQHDLRDVIAIGHSMGGVASMLAAIAEPGRFRALILLDPTFLPPDVTRLIWLMRITGQGHRFPMAQGARKRRAKFASVDEAAAYWQPKPLFSDWPAETLRLYTESITKSSGNGSIELAWQPAWEAQYYQTVFIDWRREVRKLRGLLPVLAIQGAQTDTFTDPSVRIMQRLVPDATYARIDSYRHLFPQSAPDQTRRIIEPWLKNL